MGLQLHCCSVPSPFPLCVALQQTHIGITGANDCGKEGPLQWSQLYSEV